MAKRAKPAKPAPTINPDRDLLVGEGVLTWNRHERVSDRYGTVYLMAEGGDSLGGENEDARPALRIPDREARGCLVAEIVNTRESTHIGDFFRGIRPSTPTVGDVILLGEGSIFREEYSVGLSPKDDRTSDWLDPHALYRCHEQTVRLWFIENKDGR